MKLYRSLCFIPMLVIILQITSIAYPVSKEKDRKKKTGEELIIRGEGKILAPSVAQEYRQAVREAVEGIKNWSSSISGRVVDEMGNPVQGIEVTCMDEGGRIVARTLTDRDGGYNFMNLAAGEYTIHVSQSGFSSLVEIKVEGIPEKTPPAPPAELKVSEVMQDYAREGLIKVEWEKIASAAAYRCELYLIAGEEIIPIQSLPDITQNYCEFGNILENTEYQVRVYSKNRAGYSASYAYKNIKTINKPPPPPYGLGVVSAINNRVELVWNSSSVKDLSGFVLQVRRAGTQYLYYSGEGLTPDPAKAFIIEKGKEQLQSFVIDGRLKDGSPLLENVIPYSFRVLAVDENGAFSKPSNPLENVMLEDTVPPSPPYNLTYEFITPERLRLRWEVKDADVVRYKIYYGVNPDRWDGVAFTSTNSYEILINRNQLESKELRFSVVAIDRAGNESGFRPVIRSARLGKGVSVKEDIVLSSENMYRDFSVAIREIPPVVVPKKPEIIRKPVPVVKKPGEYGFSYLREKGFTVDEGETARITGKVKFPVNAILVVRSGGKLILDDAVLEPEVELWGGIRFLEGSGGRIQNSTIRGAATGVAFLNIKGSVLMQQVNIEGCKENGLHIKNSTLELSMINLRNTVTGILIEDSIVHIIDSIIEKNDKGILARTNKLDVEGSIFRNNSSYGLRLYGGGSIKGSVFRENMVGVVLEEGRGRPLLVSNRIEKNKIDGVVVAVTDAYVSRNIISENGRNGVYVKESANPTILENDIMNNTKYAVIGGGKISKCYVAFNNGSIYVDDTRKKGLPDSIFSSSSSGVMKQIVNVDYIDELSLSPVIK
ncbi:MAG: right-handed parallel beta-helix repeat-containing protein [Spirochaetota bacterium]